MCTCGLNVDRHGYTFLNVNYAREVCVISFDSLEIKGLIPSCGVGFCYITKVTTL